MGKRGRAVLGVGRDLAGLGEGAKRSGLAMSALELARRLDRGGCEPCEACGCEGIDPVTDRDAATVAAELRQTMVELRRQFPLAKRKDGKVDEISARRAARRAGSG